MLHLVFKKRVKNKEEMASFRALAALKYPALMESEGEIKVGTIKDDFGRVLGEFKLDLEYGVEDGEPCLIDRSNRLLLSDGDDLYSVAELSKELDCYVTVQNEPYNNGSIEAEVEAKSGLIIRYDTYESKWVENDASFYNSESDLHCGTEPIGKCPKCGSADIAVSRSERKENQDDVLERRVECSACGSRFVEKWGFFRWQEVTNPRAEKKFGRNNA